MDTLDTKPAQAAPPRDPVVTFAWLVLAEALDRLDEAGHVTPCQADPDPFVSDDLHERREALKACAHCPVLDLCLTYAELGNEPFHVWGGLQPSQRRKRVREVTR